MTIRDLARDAVAPRASLAAGAAGIAFVASAIGRARGDGQAIAIGRRWQAIARRAAMRRDGFRPKGWPACAGSVMYGPTGLAAVAVVAGPSARSIADYVAIVRRRMARAPAEIVLGLAGQLLAAITIARATDAPAVRALVRDLRARLAAQPAPPVGAFAHGDVGAIAARLAAARALGEPADAAPVAALAAIEPAHVLARGGSLVRSWCNGLAGHALAWVLAAEVAGDERCRDHAFAAGCHLLEALDEAGGDLCCGLAGRAYALLAIARLDPRGPWIEHAHQLATRAIAHDVAQGGLLKGLPGVICLLHDLAAPQTARFPLVDVV